MTIRRGQVFAVSLVELFIEAERRQVRGGGLPWCIILALLTALLLSVWGVPKAWGEERPTETRVDLFDKSGNRTGSAIINERTGRIDRFDTHGRRQDGYGIIDKRDGRVDVFDSKGQRKGYGTTNGSRGGRR